MKADLKFGNFISKHFSARLFLDDLFVFCFASVWKQLFQNYDDAISFKVLLVCGFAYRFKCLVIYFYAGNYASSAKFYVDLTVLICVFCMLDLQIRIKIKENKALKLCMEFITLYDYIWF